VWAAVPKLSDGAQCSLTGIQAPEMSEDCAGQQAASPSSRSNNRAILFMAFLPAHSLRPEYRHAERSTERPRNFYHFHNLNIRACNRTRSLVSLTHARCHRHRAGHLCLDNAFALIDGPPASSRRCLMSPQQVVFVFASLSKPFSTQ